MGSGEWRVTSEEGGREITPCAGRPPRSESGREDKKRRGPKGPPLQGLFTESCAGERSPEEGEEAGTGAEAVVGIAGEVAAQHFFLVEEAEHDQGDNGEEARERPPGAKRERREEQHENGAEVHGMANEPIGSGGDDFLPFFDLDDARGETILFHDPKGDQQADEYPDLGENRKPKRKARPAETVIQAGDQQGPKDNPLGPANDGFLLGDLFLCSQPALDQSGIALQEINRGNRHGEEQQSHEDPSLPVPERTGGKEKKHGDENDCEKGAEDEPGLETAWGRHRIRRLWERQGESSRSSDSNSQAGSKKRAGGGAAGWQDAEDRGFRLE